MHSRHDDAIHGDERMSANPASSPKLLIVEDELAQLRAMCDILKEEGYVVTGSSSAKQALQAMREERFDLAITDLTMPDMDGIAFLRAAREIDPTLIGIVMTGHGSIDTAVAAMKAGAFDYVLKPFTLRAIRPVLERAMSVRNLVSENAQLRQTQEMIRTLNARLERLVEERTRQLMDANKELEAFAHSISHDLRAPLRALNSYAHLLEQECGASFNEQGRRYFDRLIASAERMEQLIEDLMRLSRVNGADIRRIDIDVSKMVAAIVEEFQAREPERRVDTLIRDGLHAKADPQLLRIALENLLGNAWKFTKHSQRPRIEFGVSETQPNTFFVRDNGAGFEAQHAESLFAPFRRLHTAAEFPGNGIGLSIVQRIIYRHGGRISAEGMPGRGATFYFTIPKQGEPLSSDRQADRQH